MNVLKNGHGLSGHGTLAIYWEGMMERIVFTCCYKFKNYRGSIPDLF